jgi:hypothetical protein
MSYIYSPDDFDANGNFIHAGGFTQILGEGGGVNVFNPVGGSSCMPLLLTDNINWEDPSLYTTPLSSEDIAAINAMSAALPELPAPPGLVTVAPDAGQRPSLPLSADQNLPPPPSPSCYPPADVTPNDRLPPIQPEGGSELSEHLHEANSSSWAARNPSRPIIRPRTPPPRLTEAQKASRKIKMDQKKEKTKRLYDAVAEYLDEQKIKIETLSRAHSVTPKHINDIIGSQTKYRTSRKTQLTNALVHAKAKEMNAGRSDKSS